MYYEIHTTRYFDSWFKSVKDIQSRARIVNRLDQVEKEHFGDHKFLASNQYELRFFFGSGYRIYYTTKGEKIVLLLSGGDKSRQTKDIKKALDLVTELE